MTQVMNHHSPASGERTPFTDLTNMSVQGNASPPGENIVDQRPTRCQNWYARMSDEQKAAYNQKRRNARAEKKAAALIGLDREQITHTHASSSPDVQRTPLTNITNTQKTGSFIDFADYLLTYHAIITYVFDLLLCDRCNLYGCDLGHRRASIQR